LSIGTSAMAQSTAEDKKEGAALQLAKSETIVVTARKREENVSERLEVSDAL